MNQKRDMQYKKWEKGVKRPIISCSIEPKAHKILDKHCKSILVKRSALVNILIIDYLKNIGEWQKA
jgi:hypothetical protein